MKYNFLTIGQLEIACLDNKYIILRTSYNERYAYNCRLVNLSKIKKDNPEYHTSFIGFRPCSFMEYLSLKVPFLNSK